MRQATAQARAHHGASLGGEGAHRGAPRSQVEQLQGAIAAARADGGLLLAGCQVSHHRTLCIHLQLQALQLFILLASAGRLGSRNLDILRAATCSHGGSVLYTVVTAWVPLSGTCPASAASMANAAAPEPLRLGQLRSMQPCGTAADPGLELLSASLADDTVLHEPACTPNVPCAYMVHGQAAGTSDSAGGGCARAARAARGACPTAG